MPKLPLTKVSSSSSDSAPADFDISDIIYPFHDFAVKNLRIFLIASRAAATSTGAVKNAGSMTGESNGLEESIVSVPPVFGVMSFDLLSLKRRTSYLREAGLTTTTPTAT